MNAHRLLVPFGVLLLAAAAPADAQQIRTPENVVIHDPVTFQALESAPLESISTVRSAPFSADAVTEFTQTLGDGNRIERRYASSIARDSRGRTRREEEIALVGPFGVTGPAPRLVTIADPETRVTYTLDEATRIAHRNSGVAGKLVELSLVLESARRTVKGAVAGGGRGAIALQGVEAAKSTYFEAAKAAGGRPDGAARVITESLGTRSIEGVRAEGSRTTSTIPAGAIGNLMPIEVVSERWFSPELQMAVLITRRDPRAGETVYRLTNIVRAEPADALFAVPPDYEVRDGALAREFKKLEAIRVSPKK